jgi:glyoxylase-like metal-dependent hydrolase (beta-lactamase superfamily II)
LPLKNHLELIEGEHEIVPGIYAIPAPGHTPGHLALVISSGTEQLLHVADAILDPLYVQHPDWRTVFDLSEAQASRTRAALLDRAAGRNTLVFGFHFPYPGFGRVNRNGNRWSWEPSPAT